jgi:hypothetical protein
MELGHAWIVQPKKDCDYYIPLKESVQATNGLSIQMSGLDFGGLF